ncbi:MAG: hypothetical protein ABIH23_05605 [bacterium]
MECLSNPMNNGPGKDTPLWQPILFAAMAGGMGWGIRGQYGHETGAMIAGLLVSLVLVSLLCRNAPSLWVARAVALGTVGICWGVDDLWPNRWTDTRRTSDRQLGGVALGHARPLDQGSHLDRLRRCFSGHGTGRDSLS